jgi:hypothetical protein
MVIPNDSIDLRCYNTWMGVDGIVRTKVKKNSEIVIEDALENSIAVNSFSQDEYPMIVDTTLAKSITKEARDYFSMKGRESKIVAFAILINSPLSKIIANFFMGLNKPRVPVKLFTDEDLAIEWCKNYIRVN